MMDMDAVRMAYEHYELMAEAMQEKYDELCDEVDDPSGDLIGVYATILPDPGGGWWAVWGFCRPYEPREEWRAWRISQRGAYRLASRKADRLKVIRFDVAKAQSEGK